MDTLHKFVLVKIEQESRYRVSTSVHSQCINIQHSRLDAVWRYFCEGFLQDAVGDKETCP